jgi:hypothetical protein
MNTVTISAITGAALLLGIGSAMASDDNYHPTPWELRGEPAPVYTGTGSDLRIPAAGTGSVVVGGNAYQYQCAEAKSKFAPNSPEIVMFCAPQDR